MRSVSGGGRLTYTRRRELLQCCASSCLPGYALAKCAGCAVASFKATFGKFLAIGRRVAFPIVRRPPRVPAIRNENSDETSPYVFPAVSRQALDKPMSRHTPDHAYAELAVEIEMVDNDGKPNIGVHDLRRTAATNLAKLGVGEDLIDRIQGDSGEAAWAGSTISTLT